jgi:uncharacterized membrane protein YdjX (TVP38/TMEM64 family)
MSAPAATPPLVGRPRWWRWWRWGVLVGLLLAFILVPFALFEGRLDALARALLAGEMPVWGVTLAVVALLVADIALPIPSSVVLAGAGYLLGVPAGVAACFIGLSCASLAGYAIGRWAGEPLALRLVGPAELARLRAVSHRHGEWLLVACRALPVLAEGTAILAGTTRMPLARYLALVSLGNAVVALLYAGIGALSATQSSLLWLTAGAMLLPLLLLALLRPLLPPRADAHPAHPAPVAPVVPSRGELL